MTIGGLPHHKDYFEYHYRDKTECVRPVPSQCHCTLCVRQPPTLKGGASDLTFRNVLNLEALKIDSRVSFKSSRIQPEFGFRPRHSTSLQLARHVERITRKFGE